MDTGRNEPCPCGSGRKFKHCHGRGAAGSPEASADATRAVALLQRGHAADAELEARRLLAIDPRFGAAWACLGFAQLQQGKDPVPALESAVRMLPGDAAVRQVLGQVLEKRGMLAPAARCLEQAVALRPDFAGAHNDLGRVRLALGDAAGAAASYRRALELSPGDANASAELAALLSDQATLLVRLGRYAEAVQQYRAAIARSPVDARLHSNLANALHCSGDFRGAIDAARRALVLDERLPEAYLHLGNALLAVSEVPQAEQCYRDGLRIAPDHLLLLTARAMALRNLSRLDEAEATARRALGLQRTPELLSLCGNLASDRGRFAEAAEGYAEALALAPELPEALVGVARSRRMTAADAPWRASAERVLARGIPVAHAVNLHHALGKYHEDLGESEAAFMAHASGNSLARRSGARYDRAATTARVDSILAAYDRAARAALAAAGAGLQSDRPVLVVGMPRSGTTLVEQILASHPDVHGADELLFWNLAADQVRLAPVAGRAASIARLGAEYLGQLARHSPLAARVVDKLPGNFENLGLIHAALPEAKLIHLERDPRDTCLSIYFQGFSSAHAYATDLEDLAHYYREYRRLMAHWRATLPAGTLLDVRYEALVADPEPWVRRMLLHLGLPWDARCLQFHRTERPVLTASAWQVRQPLNTSSVGRWRQFERYLGPLLAALGDALPAGDTPSA
ncbi:MAG: sulfotransferase [Gammaproteobacteria bacterium]|nr:sulfotransferase [Gammaproteobacteria bacterium]